MLINLDYFNPVVKKPFKSLLKKISLETRRAHFVSNSHFKNCQKNVQKMNRLKLYFLRKLYQAKASARTKIPKGEKLLVKAEICEIVMIGDIKLASEFQDNFVSKNFLKWKKDGNFQSIAILKMQNKSISYDLFKMKELD